MDEARSTDNGHGVRDRHGEGRDARSIVLSFHPFDEYTHAVATLRIGVAPRERIAAIWRGHLDVKRADLRGLSPAACLSLLCGELRSNVALADPEPDTTAVGPGAPDGATGRALVNDPLPGV